MHTAKWFYDKLGISPDLLTKKVAEVKSRVAEFFENNDKNPGKTESDQEYRDEQLKESTRRRASEVTRIRDTVIVARTNGNSCILLKYGAFLDAVAEVVNEKGSGVLDVVLYGQYVKIIVALYPRHKP